jgi:hypothetical protein
MMPYEIINTVLKQIQPANEPWIIGIQGGEALLFPQVVQYIIDNAHADGHLAGLTCSGFFRHNKKLIEFVEKSQLDYLIISKDKWHDEKINPEDTLWLVNHFKPIINTWIQYCYVWEDSNSVPEYTYKDIPSNPVIIRPMITYGRGAQFQNILDIPNFEKPCWTQCEYNGFAVEPNGLVHMQCTNWDIGCVLKDIHEVNLLDLRKRLMRPKLFSDKHFYKECFKKIQSEGHSFDCFDPKWGNAVCSDDYWWNNEFPIDTETNKQDVINKTQTVSFPLS